jgi:hypothetical protein
MPTCKSCGAQIIWVKMISGKKMPLNMEPKKRIVLQINENTLEQEGNVKDVFVSHFETCAHADQHRKGGNSVRG